MGAKNIFLGTIFLGNVFRESIEKLLGRNKNKSKEKIANREREAWEGGVALPLQGTDTLLTERLSGFDALFFCPKLIEPCLEAIPAMSMLTIKKVTRK
jgi:hypothetical protein